MTPRIISAVAAALAVAAPVLAQTKTEDKAFVSGGKVDIHLEAGDYEVRASRDNHIRVTLTGDRRDTVVETVVNGTHADVTVRNVPRFNNTLHVVIEVPKVSDVAIRLSAGDLDVDEITGSKDIESMAGDVKIAVGNPDNYSKVDASVTIGDLSAGPFGEPKGSFLSHSVNWTGNGRHTLRAKLGTGDLKLR
jgi:DUF4097 and DUF4098 domain-containing protein YvlB